MVRAGMLRVLLQDRERDLAGLQRHRQVPFAGRDRRQQRERVERRRLVVFRKLRVELRHAVGVGAVARRLVAVAEQALHGVEIALLARGRRLGLPRGARRRQPRRAPRAPCRGSRSARAAGCRPSLRPSTPSRSPDRPSAPAGRHRSRRRTRSCGAAGRRERRRAARRRRRRWERRCGRGAARAAAARALQRHRAGPSTQKRKSHGDSETQSKILLCVSVSPWLIYLCVLCSPLCPCLRR